MRKCTDFHSAYDRAFYPALIVVTITTVSTWIAVIISILRSTAN